MRPRSFDDVVILFGLLAAWAGVWTEDWVLALMGAALILSVPAARSYEATHLARRDLGNMLRGRPLRVGDVVSRGPLERRRVTLWPLPDRLGRTVLWGGRAEDFSLGSADDLARARIADARAVRARVFRGAVMGGLTIAEAREAAVRANALLGVNALEAERNIRQFGAALRDADVTIVDASIPPEDLARRLTAARGLTAGLRGLIDVSRPD